MKVHEIAKELGVKSKAVIAVFDSHERINHHHDMLSEEEEGIVRSVLGAETETVDNSETIKKVVEVKEVKLPNGVTAENVWLSCISGGTKSPYWNIKDLGKRPARK